MYIRVYLKPVIQTLDAEADDKLPDNVKVEIFSENNT